MDPRFHIGKRNAAGMFCWSCMTTLCKGGNAAIHSGKSDWYKKCPMCGQIPQQEGLSSGPGALELGFAKPRGERPQDVRGASSFTWAQSPDRVKSICQNHPYLDQKLIVDEYGRELTGQEFLDMLYNNCPIEFTDSIGEWFS